MQSLRFALLGALLASFSVACAGLSERLTADVVAINMLIETGDPFGVAPRQAGILVNLASITGPLNDPQVTPVSGASVSMAVEAGPTVGANEADPGIYQAVSGSGGTPAFVYQSNATYTVTMTIPAGGFAGEYRTTIEAPPRTETDLAPLTTSHPVGTPITVTLVGSYDRGLVIVVDASGNVTYDSRPTTPQEAVDFTLGSFGGTMEIPGTAFPNANADYGVFVVGLDSAPSDAEHITTNLHILTRFYAGSGDSAIVHTVP